MSTRCNVVIRDGYGRAMQLYRHADGYPESVIPDLKDVLPFAWDLPRFEADDFSAAIVRAWKQHGGQIYIDGTYVQGETVHGDIAYLYVIDPPKLTGRCKNSPMVKIYHSEDDFIKGKHFWKGYVGVTEYKS